MQQHVFRFIVGLGVAFGFMALLGAVAVFLRLNFVHSGYRLPEKEVMCTMEARLCPDGSAVGRSGPSCEFAPCLQQPNPSVTDFDSCAARGNPVMESSPRRCSANGQTYTEGTSVSADLSDDVRVTAPQPDAAVESPLTVRGVARGAWFFEASFPVRLVDADGRILASGAAQAESDWMTTEFVPFETTLSFTLPTTATGTLILEQDNPSGLPENTANLRLPVQFETHR